MFGQRPATAIGFLSTPDSCCPEQRFSPCETAAKSIVSCLEIHQVVHQLRSALNNLHVAYEETPSPVNGWLYKITFFLFSTASLFS